MSGGGGGRPTTAEPPAATRLCLLPLQMMQPSEVFPQSRLIALTEEEL
jgi:hypothetical protein